MRCNVCGETEASAFYPYLRTKCKACHYAYQKEYRQRQAQGSTRTRRSSRRLLCNGCNRAAGFLNDSPERAVGLAFYLARGRL